jgi:hypothetical protein
MRPVVGAGTQLDLDLRWYVTGGVSREDRRIVKEQALPVGHVGIDFQLPSIRTKSAGDAGGKRRLQGTLHPLAATFHEGLQSRLALLVAGSLVRSGIACEIEHLLVHDEIDVLGEALDELPGL